MNNLIEEGGRKIEVQKEIQVLCTEIFYSAKDILEKNGLLERDMRVPFLNHRVFSHIDHSSGQEVFITIFAATNLEKTRKMSIRIQEVGLLDVMKKGLRGEENFKATEWTGVAGGPAVPNIFFLGARSLNGCMVTDIRRLRGYSDAIKKIRKQTVLQ